MSKHRWKFFRAGGVDQVALESAQDLLHLDELDQKLWVALSCPTKGLEFDSRTLDLIDSDKDGRIRAPDMIAAVKWAAANLKDPNFLLRPSEGMPVSAINDSTVEGKQMLSSARQILQNLGKESTTITVADTTDTERIFSATKFNGDGIVPVEVTPDPFLQDVLKDILLCSGPELDRTGKPGVSQPRVDLFFKEAEAFAKWHADSEAADVLPLGAGTSSAMASLDAVRLKVEDYFVRCRLAAFDPRALTAVNRLETDYLILAAKDLSASGAEMTGFPLARVEAGKPLPLNEGVNPAWSGAVARFRDEVVRPLLGDRATLTEDEWNVLLGKFIPYRSWLAGKSGASVEKLGLTRVRDILASNAHDAINQLIAKDKALEPEMNAIAAVDRLVRYHRDLYRLLKNFVSFADFYSAKREAIFQAGRLYLDGRSCDLCLKVADVSKHSVLAVLSRTYIAYCECTRRGSAEKMTIAAGFTGGDSDNLMVGRNGIFYDRSGQDWDATIIRIVEHPISIRQAIFAPYKRVAKMIGEQVEKIAASRDKALTDKAAANIAATSKTLETGPTPPPAAPPAAAPAGTQPAPDHFDAAKYAGVFAAFGLAIGAIGSALASVASGFLHLPTWQMPLAILGALAAVSGPSAIIAILKLRQRNLGPLLDACGWAVNGRMKINIPFGAALTCVAALPPGAERRLDDPFADKGGSRKIVGFILFLLALVTAAIVVWSYAVRL